MSVIGRPVSPPQPWLRTLRSALERESAVVRIVLAAVRGSAPREAGVCMLVSRRGIEGTIGGGRLEWDALAVARILLEDASGSALLQRVVLGADLGQCCGGVVELWLERYTSADLGLLETAERVAWQGEALLESTLTPDGVQRRVWRGSRLPDVDAAAPFGVSRLPAGTVSFTEPLNDLRPPVWLFGAGHVGQALARILVDLPLRLTWIDPRADAFPAPPPAGARILRGADPLATLTDAPVGTRFIVMTHSHPLDFELCHAILGRDDFAWVGLIGSLSKSARFRSRLRRTGLTAESVARLACPIGIGGIDCKWPAAIAVGVAAQLLRELDSATPHPLRQSVAEAVIDANCSAGDCASCGVRP